MTPHSEKGNEAGKTNADTAVLLAEIEALKHRLSRSLSETPQKEQEPAPLKSDAGRHVVRRWALGLGALTSLFALIGRSAARAADALTIDADGIARFNGKRNYFTDEENVGPLRVGAVDRVPGIYSENGSVAVRAQNNDIWLNGNVRAAGLDVAGTLNAAQPATFQAKVTAQDLVVPQGTLSFGLATRQMITLNGTNEFGIGVQSGTEYFRARDNFAWYKGGTHDNGELNPGSGGVVQMVIKDGKVGIATANPNAQLEVNGVVQAKDFVATDTALMRNRMYPPEPVIFDEIFAAVRAQAISKMGSPAYDDNTYSGNSYFEKRHIIKYGGNNENDGNGAVVEFPYAFNTLWIRVLGDRWNVIHAYEVDGGNRLLSDLGSWSGGWRSANSYAPDGTLADGFDVAHQWVPIPLPRYGQSVALGRRVALVSKAGTDKDFWLSGVAFSKNPWSHTAQSAYGFSQGLNGGGRTDLRDNNWNGDSLAAINADRRIELKVPVIPSGKDKLLYFVEHNNNWNGAMHAGITVSGRPVERLMATYDSPFARHWNSKLYNRYIATRIPKELIGDQRWLSVYVDLSKQNKALHFREVGTHDLDVPSV